MTAALLLGSPVALILATLAYRALHRRPRVLTFDQVAESAVRLVVSADDRWKR